MDVSLFEDHEAVYFGIYYYEKYISCVFIKYIYMSGKIINTNAK